MASNRNNGRYSNRQRDAQDEALRQAVNDMRTAAQMLSQSSQEINAAAQALMGSNPTGRSNQRNSPYGMGGPRAMGNQTARPDHFGAGGYPGHHGGSDLGAVRQIARSQVANQIQGRFGGNFKVSKRDATGKPTHYSEFDDAGNAIGEHRADMIGGRLAANRITGAFESGGAMEALRAIPVAGQAAMAVGAVYEGAQMISNQRAANAQYQSILGGSNMAGMGQRFLQQGYRLNQLFTGGFNGAQSDQAFKGVTALGYQGGARQTRLDFASNNYRSMGMGPDESLKLIAIASQTTTTSLSDLEKQLKAVSDMAKETGQNAAAMRAQFTGNFQNLTAAGAGGGAGLIAQAQVGLTSGMGRQYANADLSGLSSTSSMMLQASQMGLSLGQYFAQNQATGGMTFAEGQQKQINLAVQAAGGGSGVMAKIQQAISAAGGAQKVAADANLQSRIAVDLLRQNAFPNPQAVDAILGSLSIDVSKIAGGFPEHVAYLIGLIAKGNNSLTGQVAQGQSSNTRQAMSDSQYKSLTAPRGAVGGTPSRAGGTLVPPDLNAVQKWETTNRTVDPALEKIYANEGGSGAKITFADGKTTTLKNALKNSDYINQIDRGSAVLASGGDSGKSIQQLGWDSVGSQVGQGGDTTGSAGTVTVNMSDATRQALTKLGITITGDPTVEAGAKANTQPKPGNN